MTMHAFRSVKVEFSYLDGMRWTPAAPRTRVRSPSFMSIFFSHQTHGSLTPCSTHYPHAHQETTNYITHTTIAPVLRIVCSFHLEKERSGSHLRALRYLVEASSAGDTSTATNKRDGRGMGRGGGRLPTAATRGDGASAGGRKNEHRRVWERSRSVRPACVSGRRFVPSSTFVGIPVAICKFIALVVPVLFIVSLFSPTSAALRSTLNINETRTLKRSYSSQTPSGHRPI
ncbi:hypothetical protein BDQ17DRAFT_1427732 [Cyathus striatus]|nr:hypothetical protein BDQ17DRAFT_1427732 [Cyathus striatus]